MCKDERSKVEDFGRDDKRFLSRDYGANAEMALLSNNREQRVGEALAASGRSEVLRVRQ